jgi:predicted RNA-binding Zn-ribbon protein involved in translation (DUF1610 family)
MARKALSFAEFQKRFPDEAACAAFIFKKRWPKSFVCPACGGMRPVDLKSRAYTYECRDCGRQTSITAGTVMHRTKLPLTAWFVGQGIAQEIERPARFGPHGSASAPWCPAPACGRHAGAPGERRHFEQVVPVRLADC